MYVYVCICMYIVYNIYVIYIYIYLKRFLFVQNFNMYFIKGTMVVSLSLVSPVSYFINITFFVPPPYSSILFVKVQKLPTSSLKSVGRKGPLGLTKIKQK